MGDYAPGGKKDFLFGGQANARAAESAGKAAKATSAEAKRQSQRAEKLGLELQDKALALSAASPQELMAMERSLNAATNLVDQDSKLLAAIDPALMEASDQALKLLRGEDAAALSPLRAQRDNQRLQLVRMLREQLGPGAETSSAGQRALQQFDLETSTLASQVQQGTLGQLLGVAQNQRGQMAGNMSALQNVGIGFGNIANRQTQSLLSAGTATLGAVTGTGQAITQNAGSPFVASMMQAQGQQAAQQNIMNAGVTLGAAYLMSDARLKKNLKRLPRSLYKGVPTYEFEYIDGKKYGHGKRVGVLAQDLLKLNPKHPAVARVREGYAVNYAALERAEAVA